MPDIISWGIATLNHDTPSTTDQSGNSIDKTEDKLVINPPGTTPNDMIRVVISHAYIEKTKPVESIQLSSNGQFMSFFVNMNEPNEQRTVCYNIKSMSTVPVRLLAPKVSITSNHELITNWDSKMTNLILQPNDEVGPYCIRMQWSDNTTDPAQAKITAYINYEQAE